LEKGPSAPGPAVRGSAGSATEAQLAEILALSGKDPKQTLLPLDVADRLTTLNNPAGTNVMPEMRWWQMALRPFRTMDMLITGQGEKGMHQALAEILADPKRLEELRKAAKFDPNARRMLMLVPAINAAGQNQGVE
jgi:hypothetical protein